MENLSHSLGICYQDPLELDKVKKDISTYPIVSTKATNIKIYTKFNYNTIKKCIQKAHSMKMILNLQADIKH